MKKAFLLLLVLVSNVAFAASVDAPKWVEEHLTFAFPEDERDKWEVNEVGYVPVNGNFVEWRHTCSPDDLFMIVRTPTMFFLFKDIGECLDYIQNEYCDECIKFISVTSDSLYALIDDGEDANLVRYTFFDEDVYIFCRGREEGSFNEAEIDKWSNFLHQIEIR